MTPKNESVYFPGLNGLRFFAALAVIITHIELLKGSFGYKNYWQEPIIFYLGSLGVFFFFVLSGFLITYLLLVEKEKFRTIIVRHFYIRRILRIWPLYYLILALGFFVLPHFQQLRIPYLQQAFEESFVPNLLLYIIILPNLAFSLFMAVPHIGQLWSIGVEEQFYIFWPLIIQRARSIPRTLAIIIIIILLVKITVLALGYWFLDAAWYKPLKTIIAMSKFECMAIGGFGAWLAFTRKEKFLNLAHNKFTLPVSLLLIPLIIYYGPSKLQDGIHLVFSVLFLLIIINVTNQSNLLEHPILSYLGKISYGIYMYHLMIIPVILYLYKPLMFYMSEAILNLAIYSSVILLTIIVSALSYTFFEKYFILAKERFSKVKSGINTQGENT